MKFWIVIALLTAYLFVYHAAWSNIQRTGLIIEHGVPALPLSAPKVD